VTGKKTKRQGRNLGTELQEIVTTMNPALYCWSVVPVCVGGGGPLFILVTWSFIRCLGRLFPRQQHIPHVPPLLSMWFFLSPGSTRSGRGSVSRNFFHEVPVLHLPSKAGFGGLFITCLVCIWLACQEIKPDSNLALLACQEVLQQALQTSFEGTVLRYGLRHHCPVLEVTMSSNISGHIRENSGLGGREPQRELERP